MSKNAGTFIFLVNYIFNIDTKYDLSDLLRDARQSNNLTERVIIYDFSAQRVLLSQIFLHLVLQDLENFLTYFWLRIQIFD